ncbi:MAG: hypothetical protein R3C28_19730 [Pirellulaceae bacterium]
MSLSELQPARLVVKYELQSVEGVSEVASIGGYVRQYQIEVDPNKAALLSSAVRSSDQLHQGI